MGEEVRFQTAPGSIALDIVAEVIRVADNPRAERVRRWAIARLTSFSTRRRSKPHGRQRGR